MWRNLFLALGLFTCIVGAECLAVQKFVLKKRLPVEVQSEWRASSEAKPAPQKEIVPYEWAPWSLLSVGAVMSLYTFTIPRRLAGK